MARHSLITSGPAGLLSVLMLLAAAPAQGQSAYQTLAGTAHDFSTVAGSGGDGCAMCHLPAPNVGAKGGGTLDAYSPGATLAAPGGMGMDTQLCLSCHDGMGGSSNVAFGVGAGQSHPVSVVYDDSWNGELRSHEAVEADGLKLRIQDGTPRVECTTCHNPHDNQWGSFLRVSNRGSALCLGCHAK